MGSYSNGAACVTSCCLRQIPPCCHMILYTVGGCIRCTASAACRPSRHHHHPHSHQVSHQPGVCVHPMGRWLHHRHSQLPAEAPPPLHHNTPNHSHQVIHQPGVCVHQPMGPPAHLPGEPHAWCSHHWSSTQAWTQPGGRGRGGAGWAHRAAADKRQQADSGRRVMHTSVKR
jgi:hypothetical protein